MTDPFYLPHEYDATATSFVVQGPGDLLLNVNLDDIDQDQVMTDTIRMIAILNEFWHDDIEPSYQLTEKGIDTLTAWIETLLDAGYKYEGDSTDIWQAAGYLIANDHTGDEYSVEMIAGLLTWGADVWELLSTETDE